MAEFLEIKPEPDIKLEPGDEIDTIEYEQPFNRLDDKCIPKVEKIEPDDDDKEEVPASFDQFGESDTFNSISNVGTKSRNDDEPVDYEQGSTLRMEKLPNMRSEVTKSRNGKSIAGTKTFTITKPNGTSRKSIKKTNNKRTALLALKKRHKCSDCAYYTKKLYNLKQHMRKHSGEKPFPCDRCDRRFARKEILQRHMKIHVNKDTLHCLGCLKIFTTEEEKLNHVSICKWRRYECFLCRAYSTSAIAHLKEHMRIHSGVRPFQCSQCLMKFTRKDHLKKHLKTHTRPQKPRCSVCARNFLTESEKVAHEMNCNKPRYDCYLCQSYMSNWKYSLQLHMRMKHTGERLFKCNSCEKCFAAKKILNLHIKTIHKH